MFSVTFPEVLALANEDISCRRIFTVAVYSVQQPSFTVIVIIIITHNVYAKCKPCQSDHTMHLLVNSIMLVGTHHLLWVNDAMSHENWHGIGSVVFCSVRRSEKIPGSETPTM